MATIVEVNPASAAGGSPSAVSWPAIFAGAVVALATTLILLALGSGLGFAAASPWPGASPSVTSFAVGVGLWLIVTQWLSSFLGGYITGRLRTRWTGVHTHEVLFRDTAHGLLAWAVSTVVVGAVAFGMGSATIGSVATASDTAVAYATDAMLRSPRAGAGLSAPARSEVVRALARDGGLATADRDYVVSVVSAQTGLSRDEAARRVDTAAVSIREAADKARKASSAIGFFTALSMVIGAFIACVSAAYAGGLRDERADL